MQCHSYSEGTLLSMQRNMGEGNPYSDLKNGLLTEDVQKGIPGRNTEDHFALGDIKEV